MGKNQTEKNFQELLNITKVTMYIQKEPRRKRMNEMKRIFLAIVDENFPVKDRQKQKSRKLTDNMQNKY